jgi:uncharacterized protein DUF6456
MIGCCEPRHRLSTPPATSGNPISSSTRSLGCKRAGLIGPDELAVAEEFRRDFRLACLDPIAACDLSKPHVSGKRPGDLGAAAIAARRRLARALGRLSEAQASAAWHVVGLDMAVREWQTIRRWNGARLSIEDAHAVLIAALAELAARHRMPAAAD